MLVANYEFYESIDNSQQDEYDIVLKASKGDKIALEYIIKKYKNFVKAKAKSYFLIGADKEDIIQEGMIGLYKAVRDFDATKTNSFKGFAEICITRQIITAIKTATRQKHIPLNSYISLNKPIYDEESERTLLDIIATSIVTDPEELIISKEELKHIESKMNELLSDLELQVVEYYLNGKSYQYIADKLKRDVKSIDNALQRVKRKLEKHLENRNDYVFSALAASIDGKFSFIASESNQDIGVLEVSMDAKFLINDGQHRKAAILEAIQEDDSLGEETISVVFFADKGLSRSQQIFTDLNKHAVKTSNSISELYDSRDDLAVVTRRVVSQVDFINAYTDKEKDILGKYSSNLFTLNTFYTANKKIIQRAEITEQCEQFLVEYWKNVAMNITQWNELINKEISKVDLRENYIVTQAVVIQAFGRVGNYFFLHPDHMDMYLKKLSDQPRI